MPHPGASAGGPAATTGSLALLLAAGALALTPAACYVGAAVAPDGGARDAGGPGASSWEGGVTGLPCDVAALLASQCLSCHSAPAAGSVPMSLVSYEDLVAPSVSNPAETVAQRSVARMLDPAAPMPPGGAPDQAGAGILSGWIAAGYPRGDCGAPDGGTNPYATAPTCTSNSYVRGEEELGPTMHPGGACISCHQREGVTEPEALFTIAGTVYPTAHEYDDCASTAAFQGQVVITDANGTNHTIGVGASGNFVSRQGIALPYRAKVVYQGRERAMTATQQSGDCNSCHTLDGANGAPGRIVLP